jgi:hypothetical protein
MIYLTCDGKTLHTRRYCTYCFNYPVVHDDHYHISSITNWVCSTNYTLPVHYNWVYYALRILCGITCFVDCVIPCYYEFYGKVHDLHTCFFMHGNVKLCIRIFTKSVISEYHTSYTTLLSTNITTLCTRVMHLAWMYEIARTYKILKDCSSKIPAQLRSQLYMLFITLRLQ